MRPTRAIALLLTVLLLPACATLPPGTQRDPRDRFERLNRGIYRFNSALDRHIAKPVATSYVKYTPPPVRFSVSNFFRNLTYPTVIVNDLLQVKLKSFASDTARLVVNTTIGIGGLFDPASQFGLKTGDEDFGQTLGHWGVPPGPYVMLPILGPSTVRDTFGLGVDQFTDPKNYTKNFYLGMGLTAMSLLDERVGLLGTDEVLDKAFDPYSFVRNAYLQRRQYQVKDGAVPAEDDVEIPTDDAPAPSGATGQK